MSNEQKTDTPASTPPPAAAADDDPVTHYEAGWVDTVIPVKDPITGAVSDQKAHAPGMIPVRKSGRRG